MERDIKKSQKIRYSRQIKVYGREMQIKLMQMKYLIYGVRGLGAEIAKHLILNGVNQVHLGDQTQVELRDLNCNYFVREEDVGQPRAEASLKRLSSLNNQVEVSTIPELSISAILENKYDGVIITEAYGLDWGQNSAHGVNIFDLNFTLRNNKIGFILTECWGMYGYLFNDFGEEHKIISTDIEEKSFNIKEISFEEEGVVTTAGVCNTSLRVDDIVEFLNVEGSKGIHMINEKEFRVKEIVGKRQVRIDGDTSKYLDVLSGAKLSLKKRGGAINFFPLAEALNEIKGSVFFGLKKDLFLAKVIIDFRRAQDGSDITFEDLDKLIEISTSKEMKDAFETEFGDYYDNFVSSESLQPIFESLIRTMKVEIITLTSIFGGIVAAEALKLTGKFSPIDQWYAYDSVKNIPKHIETSGDESRYLDNELIFGKDVQNELSKLNIFLPGVGAIGGEVLKGLALLGVGLQQNDGKITIADYDKLEISNLNRQFLFGDKDRRKYKVDVAQKKILDINPQMNIKPLRK